MGGVGLSEFKDTIKHALPHRFVRMVTKVIRPRRMQIKLGATQNNRKFVIWGEVVIAHGGSSIATPLVNCCGVLVLFFLIFGHA